MAAGAIGIPGDSGWRRRRARNFLPWVCAAVLALCGVMLIWEAVTGGYRQAADPGGFKHAQLILFVWVSAGLLLNAALITHIGFIFGCTLCYALAVQGLRRAEGQTGLLAPRNLAIDVFTGLAISAPVVSAFTQFLAISLPGLTETGVAVMDIFNALMHGFATAITPANLLWALVGCALGTAVGVLLRHRPRCKPWLCCCPSPPRSM